MRKLRPGSRVCGGSFFIFEGGKGGRKVKGCGRRQAEEC